MHIHPLPSPLRLGTDIISIPRILALLDRHASSHNSIERKRSSGKFERFLQRLLTPRERRAFGEEVVNKKALGIGGEAVGDGKGERERCARWLAGRWAAKESIIKATKPRRLLLRDIEIWSDRHREHFGLISTTSGHKSAPHSAFTSEDYQSHCLAELRYPKAEDVEFSVDGSVCSGLEKAYADEDGDEVEAEVDGKEMQGVKHEAKQLARVSISHDGDYAIAVALAVGMPVMASNHKPDY